MSERETEYLDLDDIIGLHDLILESMGQPATALRSVSILEGAIARPRNAAYYTDADLIRQACILMVAIAESQAFADGNKRTGMVSGRAFLDRNGLLFTGDPMLLAVLLIEAADKTQDQAIDDIDAWIRPFVEPLPTDEA